MALSISSIEAEFSKNHKTFGKQDAYLEFVFGDRVHKTEVLKSTGKAGSWENAVQLKGAGVNMKVIARASKALGKDTILGSGEINVVQTVGQGMQVVQLYDPDSRDTSGSVRFVLSGGSPAISGNPHTEGQTMAHMASSLGHSGIAGQHSDYGREGGSGMGATGTHGGALSEGNHMPHQQGGGSLGQGHAGMLMAAPPPHRSRAASTDAETMTDTVQPQNARSASQQQDGSMSPLEAGTGTLPFKESREEGEPRERGVSAASDGFEKSGDDQPLTTKQTEPSSRESISDSNAGIKDRIAHDLGRDPTAGGALGGGGAVAAPTPSTYC